MAKKADTTSTKEFTDGDGDVLVLRTELTKGEADQVAELSQNYRLDGDRVEFASRIREINARLFVLLTQRFTVGGEEQSIEPETYWGLDEDSGDWIDGCIGGVLKERRERRAEGNATARPQSDSPGSPPTGGGSSGTPSTTTSDE